MGMVGKSRGRAGMNHLAEVHTLYATNCRSVPDMLRDAATSIEGEDQDHPNRTVAMIAVQVTGQGEVQVYGWGETDMLHALGSLTAGSQKIGSIVLDSGQ